jgi:nucleotide-binding universal stress UspA family protein
VRIQLSNKKVETGLPAKKILVAVDGSENSKRASRAAIDLAKANPEAKLVVLNVVTTSPIVGFPAIGADTYPASLQSYYEDVEKNGKSIVEDVVELAKKENVSATGYVERSGTSVVQSVLDKASSENVDLIVLGTRGLGGFSKLLLGSVSSGVVSHAHCDVLVVR